MVTIKENIIWISGNREKSISVKNSTIKHPYGEWGYGVMANYTEHTNIPIKKKLWSMPKVEKG